MCNERKEQEEIETTSKPVEQPTPSPAVPAKERKQAFEEIAA